MDRYRLFAYTEDPGTGVFTIQDDFLHTAWEEMVASGRAAVVFFDGCVTTAEGFVDFFKRWGTHAVWVVDTVGLRPVLVAWLSHIRLTHNAEAHFCSFGPYRRTPAAMVLAYWKALGLFPTVIGFLPEHNNKAIRAAKLAGASEYGRIPKFYTDPRTGPVTGVMLAKEL